MDQPLALREALRIFRLTLIIKIAFLSLGLLVALGLGTSAQLALLLRAAPTLLLALLVLPPPGWSGLWAAGSWPSAWVWTCSSRAWNRPISFSTSELSGSNVWGFQGRWPAT